MTNETNPGTVEATQADRSLAHDLHTSALATWPEQIARHRIAAQSQPAATVQEVEDPTIADAVLSFAKARAWHHFGIAWDRLERVSQDELLEQTRGLINLPSPSKAVGPASELVDFWDLVTPDQREKLWVSLHGLACNPTLDEIPLVMEEVVAIMRPSLPTIKEVKDDAQNKLLETARRNIRMFINGAAFRDREAALACIDVLEAAIAPPSPQPDMGSGAADIRQSIIRQLGDDPYADRVILPGTDWDIVLSALSPPASQSVEKMREALEPFANALDEWGDDEGQPDRWNVWEHPIANGVTLGDFRRAKAALSSLPHKEEATPATTTTERGRG